MFTPLTASGTIVVDNAKASCYTSIIHANSTPDSGYFQIAGFKSMSMHFVNHLISSPVRLLCLGIWQGFCNANFAFSRETGTMPWFSKAGRRLLDWWEKQSHAFQTVAAVPLLSFFGYFWILECIFGVSIGAYVAVLSALRCLFIFRSRMISTRANTKKKKPKPL
jgi:hypothetical protein